MVKMLLSVVLSTHTRKYELSTADFIESTQKRCDGARDRQ
jgi:hypothetical protein